MKPVIYIDVLFLINLIFNMLIFFITSFVLKKNVSSFRIFILGLISSIYGIVMFLPNVSFLNNYVIKLLFTILCAKLLFNSKKIKEIILQSVMLFFVSFVLAGGIFAILFLTNSSILSCAVFSGGILYLDIDPFILLFGVITSIIIILVWNVVEKREGFEENKIVQLKIYKENEYLTVNALIDTGCLLSSPDGKYPAIIVEREVFESELFRAFEKFSISYKTITNNSEETLFFIPDKITDKDDSKIYYAMVVKGTDSFDSEKRFNAVLNPEMFNKEIGDEINEKII